MVDDLTTISRQTINCNHSWNKKDLESNSTLNLLSFFEEEKMLHFYVIKIEVVFSLLPVSFCYQDRYHKVLDIVDELSTFQFHSC
jgi:hypothetical protein